MSYAYRNRTLRRNKRPRVTIRCQADTYAASGERIIEFMDDETEKGGLVSIRRMANGTLAVDVYRCDPGVIVNGQPAPE